MKYIKKTSIIIFLAILSSCQDYLDVVPDNVATTDNAFSMRSQAEKYLFTCYSYMPENGFYTTNPALVAGDEIWFMYTDRYTPVNNWQIALGNQNIVDPYADFWNGRNNGRPLFEGLRDCNVFLENIHRVMDMDDGEKNRWTAEVKFLKAYYHFYLLRMYGPIPLIKDNLPIESNTEDVMVYRDPVDDCVDYIVHLLDEAVEELPEVITDEYNELGRITKPVALALKARVLVTAASPLFNGNTDFSSLIDNKGRHLINQTEDPAKWDSAMVACQKAIDLCHSLGYALYQFNQSETNYNISPEIEEQLSIRNAVCEKWNREIIWANTQSWANDIQRKTLPKLFNFEWNSSGNPQGVYSPTLKIAELFYTKHGVPIDEDVTWDYAGRYNLRTATEAEKYYIKTGEQTAALHFDREPRFYADLGFDRGVWYGNGSSSDGNFNSDAALYVKGLAEEMAARAGLDNYSITGYYAKKLVNYQGVVNTSSGVYSAVTYPWPEFRLADLYLLYAEALNEVSGPTSEALYWINKVRERAGLSTVEEAWTNYSSEPTKYTTKSGLREIIHQERLIELAFEGHRFWDLRRWKTAHNVVTGTVRGWDIDQKEAESYYRSKILYNQVFQLRDYFWPLKETDLQQNRNLIQNPGW